MAIKLNLSEIIAQVKPIERATRKKKEAAEGTATISSRASNIVDGDQFSTVVALHEYVFGKMGTEFNKGATGAAMIEGTAASLMDKFFPGTKNPDTKTAKRLPVVRIDASGNVLKAGIENLPVNRAYNTKHYDYYLRKILKLNNFRNAEEVGVTQEEIEAAVEAYAGYQKANPTRGTVVEEVE